MRAEIERLIGLEKYVRVATMWLYLGVFSFCGCLYDIVCNTACLTTLRGAEFFQPDSRRFDWVTSEQATKSEHQIGLRLTLALTSLKAAKRRNLVNFTLYNTQRRHHTNVQISLLKRKPINSAGAAEENLFGGSAELMPKEGNKSPPPPPPSLYRCR